jgi:tetratricopeptide (TPR) repeat protein
VEHEPPFGAAHLGRAEARLALIELQAQRNAEAARHAARAETLCAAQCAWRPALLNVQAAIAARSGDASAAEARAREALAAATGAGDAAEQAGAWRILAELAAALGRGDEARKAWSAALDIDTRVEAPERVALDLLGLARLEQALGDRAAARRYARRAQEVADAARLGALAGAARDLLRETE